MADVNCELCGGTDFYKEEGFFYCKECQTQTQELKEHVFGDLHVDKKPKVQVRTKKIRKKTEETKPEDQVTSWECYNYILLGLVNELIELGANRSLKDTVKTLWMQYLRKLEVINPKDPTAPPKLAAVNSKIDAEIIYGRRAKKYKKRKRSPSPSSGSGISSSFQSARRDRSALAQKQYQEYTSAQQSTDNISLQNQTLSSLKGSSEVSKNPEHFLRYNKLARKELLKKMTKTHLQNHCRDVNSTLSCHSLGYRGVASTYTHSALYLSRCKLYALLYLGLLINRDDVQLGDMLRFIREGHLSYNHINHFFPEELANKKLNIKSYAAGTRALTHLGIRIAAAKVAKVLKLSKYIRTQNLEGLCGRYCAEMNLPNDVCRFSLNLISISKPRMTFTMKSNIIPNYEGRAMSIIIFLLKLYFGLDDVTEYKFTELAQGVNEIILRSRGEKMFCWKQWITFIEYRKLVISKNHFPTQFLFDNGNFESPNLFINFMNEQYSKREISSNTNVDCEVLKKLLEKLRSLQKPLERNSSFPATLTPFKDYLEIILSYNVNKTKYLVDILNENFTDASLDFLIAPKIYLEAFCESVTYKHKGANDNFAIVAVRNLTAQKRRDKYRAKALVPVLLVKTKKRRVEETLEKVSGNGEDTGTGLKMRIAEMVKKGNCETSKCVSTEEINEELEQRYRNESDFKRQQNAKETLKYFKKRHSKTYKKNMEELAKLCEQRKLKLRRREKKYCAANSWSHAYHYFPYERCWSISESAMALSKKEFEEFLRRFPYSFQLLLTECSRAVEQTNAELLEEFNVVELYLSYVHNFTTRTKEREKIVDVNLDKLVNKAKKCW